MKKILATLTAILLSLALVAGIINVAIAVASNEKAEYVQPREGYMYYKLEDIPDLFELYTGYTPKMVFESKDSMFKVYLKDGYTVSIPMKQYGPDFWALEVPADMLETIFCQWQVYAYKCFDYQSERAFYQKGLNGIYYGWDTVQEIFKELTGSKHDLGFRHLGTTKFLISVKYSANETVSYEIKNRGIEYEYADDGDFILDARVLSQIIYDWEMANVKYKEVNLGNLLDF